MPDETTPPAASAQAAPPAVTPPAPAATTTPDPQAGDGQDQISLEEARKLRKEAQALRTRLKGYEDKEAADRDAQLSEIEKISKRATEADKLVNQYKQELIASKVQLAAQAKGIIDPELAAMAIQKSLEYGDDGMPTNLDKALDDLLKSKPFLSGQSTAASASPSTMPQPGTPALPAMNPGRSAIPSPNALLPGQRKRLSELL